jgi:sulfatase modifying factor 1
MALVPVGCFMMGSTDGDADEQPVRQVCFEEPFWIDVYEVIQIQFNGEAGWPDGCYTGLYWPRDCITWTESAAFCEKRGGRLPTEAEWEYVARGPDGLKYPWGNEFIADNVVYRGNSDRPQVAGNKPGGVSWIGAFDLGGNVWEWVNDWYGAYPSGKQVNPTGPDSGDTHVIRGGSWTYGDDVASAVDRYSFAPDFRDAGGGFRCRLPYRP